MSTITVTHLGKAYKQHPTRWSRPAEWLDPRGKARHHLHWVLQDINFTVNPGEAVERSPDRCLPAYLPVGRQAGESKTQGRTLEIHAFRPEDEGVG